MTRAPTQADMVRPYTLAEVAARWGCHKDTVRGLIRAGKLPCLRVTPRKVLISAADVDAYERTVRVGSLSLEGVGIQAGIGSSSGQMAGDLSDAALARLTRNRLNAS